ncbi:ribonuclease H2 subunit C [Blastomyces parvus]|uniref:Ribonuclease H2 subunit C n=1 Tax=Blastomyces parvus TaxID=2060905 RepID=A0A2B7WYC0_9EURO|nr:ribonuclease H2 subunit C [Blastomyces parvus]
MFAIQLPKNKTDSHQENSSITPNILPCRIHHDGPVEISTRYWNPVVDESNPDTATAYFRGRKLRGRRVPIPDGYEGVIACTNSLESEAKNNDQGRRHRNFDLEDEEDDDNDEDYWKSFTIVEKQGSFSDFMVWDHEKVPAADDPFVKGVSEWIRFAEAMHTAPSHPTQQDNGGIHVEQKDRAETQKDCTKLAAS